MVTKHLQLFHAVDTALWFDVERKLRKLSVATFDNPHIRLSSILSSNDALLMAEFCSQMNFAYIHPRRSSVCYSLAQSVPQNRDCSIPAEEKPKSTAKAV